MRIPALAVPLASSLAAALLAGGCVEEPTLGGTSEFVIGGTPTPEGDFPSVGALIYSFGGQQAAGCTGTLIAPDAVLTAAHCLDPEVTGGPLPVGFSLKNDITGSVNPFVPAMSSTKHESFDIRGGGPGLDVFFDVGIVRLAEPITDIAPTRMPTMAQAASIVVGLDLDIVGYGQTSDADPGSTGVLFNARTKIIEINPTEMRVSTGTPDPQNCHGDSGGPALAEIGGETRVIGIVSRSYQSGQCDNGGVDTRVDAYLTWIHGQVPTGIPCGSGLSAPCDGEEEGDDDGGCCSTGSGGTGSVLLAFAAGALLLAPRRRRRG